MNVWAVVFSMLYHPALATVLGWMFGISILIGGILDNHGRDLKLMLVSVAMFSTANGVASFAYMDELGNPRSEIVVIYAAVVTVIWCVGLWIGWFTVYQTRMAVYKKEGAEIELLHQQEERAKLVRASIKPDNPGVKNEPESK